MRIFDNAFSPSCTYDNFKYLIPAVLKAIITLDNLVDTISVERLWLLRG